MVWHREHREVLGRERRASRRSASAYRAAISEARENWRRLRSEAARKEHRVALSQNPWLLALAERIARIRGRKSR